MSHVGYCAYTMQVAAVACGEYNGVAITAEGAVWAWGGADHGMYRSRSLLQYDVRYDVQYDV